MLTKEEILCLRGWRRGRERETKATIITEEEVMHLRGWGRGVGERSVEMEVVNMVLKYEILSKS